MVEALLTIALFVGILVCVEIGYRIGRRSPFGPGNSSSEMIGTVDAAVFGLLGLILAFTFSGASERLVVRRAQIVQEANAIGTAYLRIDLLAPSEQPRVRELFREYLESRITAFDRINDQAATDAALDKCSRLQREIWSRSLAGCSAGHRTDACLLVVPALNEMIDITTTRTMATRTHAPVVILFLLVVLALVAGMLTGHAMSHQPTRSVLHMVLFSVVVSASIYVVLDLEYPRAGLITLRSMDQALHQLRETMR